MRGKSRQKLFANLTKYVNCVIFVNIAAIVIIVICLTFVVPVNFAIIAIVVNNAQLLRFRGSELPVVRRRAWVSQKSTPQPAILC